MLNLIELLQTIRYELWQRTDGECICGNCLLGKRLMKMIDETLDHETHPDTGTKSESLSATAALVSRQ